jgi:hypothetical protein
MLKMNHLTLILLSIIIGCLQTQAQIVETSKGKVEFIGLEKWTTEMLQEKLGYKSTDNFHFCAADLKSKLGFADASVTLDSENGKMYTIITVVEPSRVQQVQYKPKPTGSVAIPDSWSSLTRLVETRGILNEILDYGSTFKNSIKTEKPLLAGADTGWWKLLQERRTKEDFQTALRVLTEDKEFKNRSTAALILTNFHDKDAAWLALKEGVRDKDGRVNSAALQGLITLTKYVPRKIDWSPATPSIRHILNGTNLFALPHVIKTLQKTKASRKLAKNLFKKDGGRMLLVYLKARNEERKSLSQNLLMQMSGKNFGSDTERWEHWLEAFK